MPVEDRTIDTSGLRQAVGDGAGWLQLAEGLLDRLDPAGVHVVVPAGRVVTDGEDVVYVELVLKLGDRETPARVRVPMPLERFSELPTTYDALVRFQRVVGAAGDVVERWLAERDVTPEADDDA